MSLYAPAAGDRILAADVAQFFNILKGVTGSGEAITLIYNAAGVLIFQPSTNPAAGTEFLQIKNAAGTVQAALSSDGKFYAADGTATVPGITFESDKDTGIYRSGANAMKVTAGGTDIAPLAIATATVAGFVPTPPNDTAKFLRGDATWAAPVPGDLSNYLTNPGFEIDQRGGTVTTTNNYAHDRWLLTLAGTDTCTITDETTVVDTTSLHSLKAVVVVGTGAGASNIGQVLKNADLGATSLRGQTVCFAIRVRTATASACKAAITTDGTGGATTLSGFHTGGGTFETLSVSVAVPTDATTLTVKVTFAVSCTAYLDNATLVIGSSAQTYYPLPPAEEWERCTRYYELHHDAGVGGGMPALDQHAAVNATIMAESFSFVTKKAVAPTATKNGTWAVSNCDQPTLLAPGTMGYQMYVTATTAATRTYVQPDTADDTFTFEANP